MDRVGQKEYGWARGNMGGPEGIFVVQKEYGWARGNICGPEGIWVGQREYRCARGNVGVPVGIWVCQREYRWARGNVGVPVGIWVCQWEYVWARGNMCAIGNMGGPEGTCVPVGTWVGDKTHMSKISFCLNTSPCSSAPLSPIVNLVPIGLPSTTNTSGE